jgi:hypothetical protein
LWPDEFVSRIESIGERDVVDRDAELAHFHSREVEHIGDEACQILLALRDALEVSTLLLGDGPTNAHLEQLHVSRNGVERRAQLVAHDREELRLRLVRDRGCTLRRSLLCGEMVDDDTDDAFGNVRRAIALDGSERARTQRFEIPNRRLSWPGVVETHLFAFPRRLHATPRRRAMECHGGHMAGGAIKVRSPGRVHNGSPVVPRRSRCAPASVAADSRQHCSVVGAAPRSHALEVRDVT